MSLPTMLPKNSHALILITGLLIVTCVQVQGHQHDESPNPSPSRPPHIVYVFADDYGWHDVGYHSSEISTPNIDQLAADGVKLENYYVQPMCTPSRSQFMTGRYQIHTGLQHAYIRPIQPNGLPLDLPTVADMLRKQGYATHIIGKWHLGMFKTEYTPIYRGFDTYFGFLGGSEHYASHRRSFEMAVNGTHRNIDGLDLRQGMKPVLDKNGTYSAHVFAQQAEKLINEHAAENSNQPMFLYLPFQSVHEPLEAPDDYVKKYSDIKDRNRRIFAGMVTCMDEAIGNITKTLKRTGLWENTVFIFSTDNGGQVYQGGNNWPLRGWKTQLWEGGIHGVGFVSSPLLEKRGTENHELIHVSDWFPTIVNLAGGSTEGMGIDGVDQWQTISKGTPSPRKELLHNIDPLHPIKGHRLANSTFDNRVRAAIRVGDWKLITGDPGDGTWVPPPHLSHLSKHLSTTTEDPDKNLWLFNIREDPMEIVDLSEQYPVIVDNLLKRLTAHNATAVKCHFPPDDPLADPALHGDMWGPWRD